MMPTFHSRLGGFRETEDSEERYDPIVVSPHDFGLIEVSGIDLRVGQVYVGDKIEVIDDVGKLEERVKSGKLTELEPKNGEIVLEADENGRRVFYITSYEKIKLPDDLALQIDAKSTTGRVACMAGGRMPTFAIDYNDVKSIVRSTSEHPIITMAQPYNFDLIVRPGKTSLVSATLRGYGDRYMTKEEVIEDRENIQLFQEGRRIDLGERGRFCKDGFAMKFSTQGVVRAKRKSELPGPIDMDAKGVYDPWRYFDAVESKNGEVLLEAERFYLMGTLEEIRLGNVCAFLSRETHETGTGLWGHFAGTVQPGFVGEITMECRTNVDKVIRRGDYAAFFQCDKVNISRPIGSHEGSYQNQKAPLFPKMFKK
jgi:deoxycytidine triphosphate deaminase